MHQEARTGFEVVGIQQRHDGWVLNGCTAAVEDGEAWVVDYEIHVSADWETVGAHVTRRVGAVSRSVTVERDGHGRWRIDGDPRADLDG